nr:MAG TPA: hypothetical protein [Caudoviricetes sp.]
MCKSKLYHTTFKMTLLRHKVVSCGRHFPTLHFSHTFV